MESSLKMNWEEVQLIELLETLESGSRPKGGVRGIMDGVPSVGGEHLNDNGGFDFSNIKYIPKSFAEKLNRGKIEEGDILIVKDGATTGKTSFIDLNFPYKKAFVNEHVFICRPSKNIHSKYLYWFLKSKDGNERIMENFKGSAQGGINQTFASNTLVPLAPLPEQQRIVAKLDELMEKIDRSRARLERIPKILKRFRQSILSAAVSGKLTEEWREKRSSETVSDLKEAIHEERLKNYNELVVKCAREGKRKPKRPVNLDEKIVIHDEASQYLNDLPNEWQLIPLAFATGSFQDSIVDGPFGSSINVKVDYIDSGIPVIRINNIRPLKFVNENLKYVHPNKFSELKRHNIKPGDILLAKVGATIGDCCIYPNGLPEAMLSTTGSCRISVDLDYFDIHFINLVLNSLKNVLQQIASEVAQPFLNMSTIKALPIPLCSIEEQREIVRRVEQLFALAEKIEVRYTKAKAQADRLPQSLLAKAFRGELVAQDENDEPACVLLERIRHIKSKPKIKNMIEVD